MISAKEALHMSKTAADERYESIMSTIENAIEEAIKDGKAYCEFEVEGVICFLVHETVADLGYRLQPGERPGKYYLSWYEV